MRKARSLVGLNVIAQAGGTVLGRVRDLIFDHDSSELLAVVLSEKDLFGLIQAQVVPWREVVSVGPNAIVVQSAASKMKAGDDERLNEVVQRQTSLGGTRIFTTDGRELGVMADVFVDEASGRVEGYEISGGFISDTLRGKRFMPTVENVQIGKDVAFVPPDAAAQMQPQAFAEGSWQHGTVAASERFSQLAGATRERAETLYSQMATASATKQEEWVIGRVAARDVRLPAHGPAGSELEQPETLVHAGEVITSEAARRARELGLLGNLTIAAIESSATNAYAVGKEKLTGPRGEARSGTFSETPIEGTEPVAPADAPTTSSNPLETVQAKAAAAAVGKPAGRDVLRPDGTTLIATSEIITEAVLTEARALGKENEVIAAAGLGAAQAGLENAREQAAGLWSQLKNRAEEWGGAAQVKRSETEEQELQRRVAYTAGRRASRVVLDPSDAVIVNAGDIITYAALNHARQTGVLEVLLDAADDVPAEPVAAGAVPVADTAEVSASAPASNLP